MLHQLCLRVRRQICRNTGCDMFIVSLASCGVRYLLKRGLVLLDWMVFLAGAIESGVIPAVRAILFCFIFTRHASLGLKT
ncbi:hypothetical protein FOXYSP1_02249 [Fusarium oxysporum f. sp. phaseoli]